jgi:hypothetical protein
VPVAEYPRILGARCHDGPQYQVHRGERIVWTAGWGVPMGLLRRRRRRPGTVRGATSADLEHLREFARTRQGVEAFLEPRTAITETTVVLVAADGEWTRRRVDGPQGAASFAKKAAIPLYDVGVVGYPKRMREYNERRKAAGG